MTRPGDGLRRIAARVCDRRTMARLVDPIVADLQIEYETATARGDRRAWWLVWRGYGAFWKALGLHCVMSAFQPSPSGSHASLGRVVAASLGALTIMTALMIVPPMVDFRWDGGPLDRVRLILFLVPQALPLSIPSGVCGGIMCAMRGRPAGARQIAGILAVATVATFAVWTTLEWGVPAGNQAFREFLAARLGDSRPVHLEPGLNELGLSRLSQRTDARAVHHTRLLWALCFATGPLALFSLGLARVVRHLAVAFVFSLSAIVTYWAIMAGIDAALRAGSFGGAGAWAGNILFMAAGVLLLRQGRRSSPRAAA